jgi:hypothetical protein
MRRYYLMVEFHSPHKHPIGSNPVKLDRRPDMELYRDLDVDPGTLVAVTAAVTMEYPWTEVKQSVVAPPAKAEKAKP